MLHGGRAKAVEVFSPPKGGLVSLPLRSDIRPGLKVQIVEKQNQRSGAVTEGVVARILTSSPTHPHGIKVMLEDGRVGRVKAIVNADA
jgi:uncharacterized repeat protein (TIGR03833 family)